MSIRLHDYLQSTWDQAKGPISEDLQAVHESIRKLSDEVFGASDETMLIQAHTTSATIENNFVLADGANVITVSTTDAVFGGFTNPSPGREFVIAYTGSGSCWIKHQSSTSIANFRVTCPSINGLIVGTGGAI